MNHTITSIFFIALHIFSIGIFIFYSYVKGWLNLNHKSLFHQKLFWISILIPFLSFLYYGLWAWYGHTPDLSAAGFEVFYNISKVPLLFLAASVPLASIVNNIHRTIQTEKQIAEAERKNFSDSYYTHFKNTLDLMKGVESNAITLSLDGPKMPLKINNPVELYNKIYNKSSYVSGANYEIDKTIIEEIEINWHKINKSLRKLWPLMIIEGLGSTLKVKMRILINLYRLESSFEKICHTLTLGNLNLQPRPVFTILQLSYTGLFHDEVSLTRAIKELEKICLKFFDIIHSNDGNYKRINSGRLLENNVYLNFHKISAYRDGSNLLTTKVSIAFNKPKV